MSKAIHPLAGALAMVTIATFWLSTAISELFASHAAIVAVKTAIPWGFMLLVPALAAAGGSGRVVAQGRRAGLVGAKLSTPRGRLCANPKCLQVSSEDDSFCTFCSANLRGAQLVCGQCSKPVDDGWKICANCGNQLIREEISA